MDGTTAHLSLSQAPSGMWELGSSHCSCNLPCGQLQPAAPRCKGSVNPGPSRYPNDGWLLLELRGEAEKEGKKNGFK